MVDDDDDDVRNEYALRIVSQLPDVRADGRLSFPIPDFFQDFIVHPPNPTLTGKRPAEEADFHRRPLIIWAPDIFWNEYCPKLRCPNPKCPAPLGEVIPKEWNSSGVRTVHGVDRDWDLISKRYRCKACAKTFCATDERCIAMLPAVVRRQFPAVLRKKSGHLRELDRLAARCSALKMKRVRTKALIGGLRADRVEEREGLQRDLAAYREEVQRRRQAAATLQRSISFGRAAAAHGDRGVSMEALLEAVPVPALLRRPVPKRNAAAYLQRPMPIDNAARSSRPMNVPIRVPRPSARKMSMPMNTARARPVPTTRAANWRPPALEAHQEWPSSGPRARGQPSSFPQGRLCKQCGKSRKGHPRSGCS